MRTCLSELLLQIVKKSKAPSWVTRGLHSENGGGRGLTARDAVCVDLIITNSDPIV